MAQDLSNFYVILVEPKYEGNVGAVARCMSNFEFKNLFLVKPCKLGNECYARAKHAQDVLKNAKKFSSVEEATKKMDFLVATSSIYYKKDKKHLRNPVILEEFSDKIFEIEGKIGLLFGREDYGLYNEEIAKCDTMIKIPSSESYLTLNLSHAVCIFLYTLFTKKEFSPSEKRTIDKLEKEKLFEFFSKLLDSIDYPDYKKDKTKIMFKRMMGRAMPSKWEYHTLMGVISDALDKIKE